MTMDDSASRILLQSLTEDEYNSLPEPIRNKILVCLNENFENFLTSKAVFESTRLSNGRYC